MKGWNLSYFLKSQEIELEKMLVLFLYLYDLPCFLHTAKAIHSHIAINYFAMKLILLPDSRNNVW